MGDKKGKPEKPTGKEKKPAEDRKAVEDTREDIRYIVRIANKDLNGRLKIARALIGLKGINHRYAKIVTEIFLKEAGLSNDTRLGDLPEEMDSKLEDIVLNPVKYKLPEWTLNRRKDFDDGITKQLVMNELDFAKRKDLQRLSGIKSYRGLRHVWRLPVRGQKTKSTHRGKGGTVGVHKKDRK
ncbi:MAG: 30S ribosomal protein S13 [Candidatus Diapherotrites archaeon]